MVGCISHLPPLACRCEWCGEPYGAGSRSTSEAHGTVSLPPVLYWGTEQRGAAARHPDGPAFGPRQFGASGSFCALVGAIPESQTTPAHLLHVCAGAWNGLYNPHRCRQGHQAALQRRGGRRPRSVGLLARPVPLPPAFKRAATAAERAARELPGPQRGPGCTHVPQARLGWRVLEHRAWTGRLRTVPTALSD